MSMEFVIDHRIRDWVFIPILYVMFMMGLLRMFLSKVMQSKNNTATKALKTLNETRSKTIMTRSQKLQSAYTLLSPRGFFMRRSFFLKKEGTGHLWEREKDAQENPMDALSKGNPMMNPNNMAGMLKNNLFMTIMTPLQFGFISYFFTGYIVGKVPFPLTQKFREMLQRGVENNSLDVKYVSALSLYFLTIFGFNSVYKMILSNDSDDAFDPMSDPSMNPTAMMGPMGGGSPFGQPPDMKKMYATERDNLEVVQHEFKLAKGEEKL